MNKTYKWIEQYHRMMRWYKRISSIYQGVPHNTPSEYYQDEVYTFFINCYHLKDWICNDNALKIKEKQKKLKEFIDNSENMKICHDVCNGLKHLALDPSKAKADKNTQFGSRRHNLILGVERPIYSAKYSIKCKGKILDAFSLATVCIKEWDNFIKKQIGECVLSQINQKQ